MAHRARTANAMLWQNQRKADGDPLHDAYNAINRRESDNAKYIRANVNSTTTIAADFGYVCFRELRTRKETKTAFILTKTAFIKHKRKETKTAFIKHINDNRSRVSRQKGCRKHISKWCTRQRTAWREPHGGSRITTANSVSTMKGAKRLAGTQNRKQRSGKQHNK